MTNLGKTKINNLNIWVFIFALIQEIFWFEISMCNFLGVAIVNCLQNLFENRACVDFIKIFLFDNLVKKLTTCTHLSDQINILRVLKILVQFKYMRMVQTFQNVNFCLKTLLIFNFLSCNCFASSYLPSLQMDNLSDNTICATTQSLLFHFVDICDRLSIFGNHCFLLDEEIFYDRLHYVKLWFKISNKIN